MKFGNVDIPEGLSYTKNHLWAKITDTLCILGWTDFIQSNAGDINYVELPEKGALLKMNRDFGTIETSKWVDRLHSPVDGRVLEVNNEVIQNPELINKSPFSDGWLLKVELESQTGLQDFMSSMEYFEYIKVCEEL